MTCYQHSYIDNRNGTKIILYLSLSFVLPIIKYSCNVRFYLHADVIKSCMNVIVCLKNIRFVLCLNQGLDFSGSQHCAYA
jgi:hypothetical protein